MIEGQDGELLVPQDALTSGLTGSELGKEKTSGRAHDATTVRERTSRRVASAKVKYTFVQRKNSRSPNGVVKHVIGKNVTVCARFGWIQQHLHWPRADAIQQPVRKEPTVGSRVPTSVFSTLANYV